MKMLLCLLSVLLLPAKALANPACVVCTVAIGASLELARKLGISDNIVGLWAGAMTALLGCWAILWFDRKNWHFAGRDFWLMFLSIGMIGFVYFGQLVYTPRIIGFLYIDAFLLSALTGAAVYILTEKLYALMKAKNGGHAHFPFEKVVLPVAALFICSVIMNFYQI